MIRVTEEEANEAVAHVIGLLIAVGRKALAERAQHKAAEGSHPSAAIEPETEPDSKEPVSRAG